MSAEVPQYIKHTENWQKSSYTLTFHPLLYIYEVDPKTRDVYQASKMFLSVKQKLYIKILKPGLAFCYYNIIKVYIETSRSTLSDTHKSKQLKQSKLMGSKMGSMIV